MCGLVTYLCCKKFHPFNKCSCGARSFNKRFISYPTKSSRVPYHGLDVPQARFSGRLGKVVKKLGI